MKTRHYKTIGHLSIEEVLSYRKRHLFFQEGLKIRTHQERLDVFRKSLSCPDCGIKGNTFLIQKNGDRNWHLNLWYLSDKRETLMTIDHKIPKSKGGSDASDNLQTMCDKCNNKKGDKILK